MCVCVRIDGGEDVQDIIYVESMIYGASGTCEVTGMNKTEMSLSVRKLSVNISTDGENVYGIG